MRSEKYFEFVLAWFTVWGFISISTGQTQTTEDQLKIQDEVTLKNNGSCLLSGEFLNKDTSCWATGMFTSPRAAGENSYCHVITGPDRGLFKCQKGIWIPAAQTGEASLKRERKGWFWRRRRRRRRSPPPPPPNQAPRFTSCPGNIHVTASANQTTAVVTWSVQAADKESTPSVTQNQGPPPGSNFNEGSTVISYTATDSAGATANCAFSVTVSVVRCPNVGELSHFALGSQSCNGIEKNIYGSVCQHSCDTGHVLQGQRQVTCQSSGSWSSSFPSCQPVSCGAPGTAVGGQVVCPQGHVFSHTCIVQCLPGYQNSGVTSISCESSGQWSSQFSPCTDIEAPKFPNGCPPNQQHYSGPLEAPVTVTWVDPVATDNNDQTVTLTSNLAKGSLLGPGHHTVTLTARDQAGNKKTCQFDITIEAKQCQVLQPPPNGVINCTRNNVEGSACTTSCNLGYRVKGTATLLCLNTEQWDNSPPTCEAILCRPPSISDGSFVCPLGYQHPAQCTLTCWRGFQVQSPVQIQCLENATWSTFGSCQDIQPPQFTNGCPADINVYASPLGSDTVAKWSPPAVSDNSRDSIDLQSDFKPGASFPAGSTTVTYKATDDSGNVATCQFSVTVTALQCKDPSTAFPNKDMKANIYTCNNSHVYGAMCTVSCAQGYTLVGESTITCEKEKGTHPPALFWRWGASHSGRPVCREDRCPPPPAPKNGAISCYQGSLGPNCLMSCQASWDLPYSISGHIYCLNAVGKWFPNTNAVERGCVARRVPHRQVMKASLFYFTNDCSSSTDELRQNFITRMKNSVFKDACVSVPSCSAENVKVTCGPVWPSRGRTKRGAGEEMSLDEKTWLRRAIRQGAYQQPHPRHYYLVKFEVHVPYVEDKLSPEKTYTKYMSIQELLRQRILNLTREGKLDIGDEVVKNWGVGPTSMRMDCPPGTLLRQDHQSLNRFSCVGCSKGHYLPSNSTQCLKCPQGQYTEEDSATACTPCPSGWSTSSTGAQHSSQCIP